MHRCDSQQDKRLSARFVSFDKSIKIAAVLPQLARRYQCEDPAHGTDRSLFCSSGHATASEKKNTRALRHTIEKKIKERQLFIVLHMKQTTKQRFLYHLFPHDSSVFEKRFRSLDLSFVLSPLYSSFLSESHLYPV